MITYPNESERIVVGVDGSEASQEALRWAVHQAELENSSIDAVMAWKYPPFYGSIDRIDAPKGGLVTDVEISASQNLSAAIRAVERDTHAPPIHAVMAYGTATAVLRKAAQNASLLVLGRRKLRLFGGALHGGVRQHIALSAPCPVVII